MKFLEFFQESNGVLSNTRLNSTLCVWTALVLVVIAGVKGVEVGIDLVIILLTYGFGSKLIQKPLEKQKINGDSNPTS